MEHIISLNESVEASLPQEIQTIRKFLLEEQEREEQENDEGDANEE